MSLQQPSRTIVVEPLEVAARAPSPRPGEPPPAARPRAETPAPPTEAAAAR